AADEIALQVGAAEPEIGVGEGVDHGIGFEPFVAGEGVPIPERLELAVADRQTSHPALVAAGVDLRTIRADAADRRPRGEKVGENLGGDVGAIPTGVANVFSVENDVVGIELSKVDLTTHNERTERAGETVELIVQCRVWQKDGRNVPQCHIGVTLLGKWRTQQIRVAGVRSGDNLARAATL